MPRPSRWPIRLAVGVTAGALSVAVAACGSTSASSTGNSGAASSGTTTVTVGVLPIADVAPLYLGMKQGFFAKQHLKVVPHALQGGAAVASAVIGGSLQFGFGATANLVLASASGLPLQFIANGDQAATTPDKAWSGILVGAKSKITSVSQLSGKTVAANATKGENELALDALLLKSGVQPSAAKVVAIPFPTMPTSLTQGQVTAVTEVEPFVSQIKAGGGSVVTPLFEGMQPGMIVAGYFTTKKTIAANPDLVKRFVAAMNTSLAYAQAHPAAVRSIIPTYTKIPASVAAKMNLPVWGSKINTTSITSQEKLMQQLGWLKSTLPLSQLVWSGASQ